MNIVVVAVGKIKETYLTNAVKEYAKRLGRYCKLQIIEVEDEKAPENLSPGDEQRIKKLEGDRILRQVKEGAHMILLDIHGKQMDSVEFAGMLENLGVTGRSDITFVIGGSLGVSGEVCGRADFRLSFSRMTFPHQLMRIFLLEQVYRAFRIIKGEPYHK